MVTEPNLLAEGFTLLVMGMGFVFVFLALLVFAIGLMSTLIQKYTLLENTTQEVQPSFTSRLPSPQLLSAITAAIHLHKSKQY